MKAEILLCVFILALFALGGCSSLPSMQYCDKVSYQRDGLVVTIHAECRAPISNTLPGL